MRRIKRETMSERDAPRYVRVGPAADVGSPSPTALSDLLPAEFQDDTGWWDNEWYILDESAIKLATAEAFFYYAEKRVRRTLIAELKKNCECAGEGVCERASGRPG